VIDYLLPLLTVCTVRVPVPVTGLILGKTVKSLRPGKKFRLDFKFYVEYLRLRIRGM
jgi:hypothetical protein